jgi:hypothetical protein
MRCVRLPALVTLLLSLATSAVAEDFRVDSKVFVAKETEPHSTNVTLFQGTHVYDFLDIPRQIAIYDLQRGRVVLVNPERRVKCEVSPATLDAFCNNLRHLENRTDDPVLDFAVRPTFDERTDKDGERVFASKYVTYRVAPQTPELTGMAARYRQFSDASARLNALVNRGSMPPFPRLLVNQSLAASEQIPAKVELTVASGRLIGGRTVHLHSTHEFRPRLLDSDMHKIDEAGQYLATATDVSLSEYLNPRVGDDP